MNKTLCMILTMGAFMGACGDTCLSPADCPTTFTCFNYKCTVVRQILFMRARVITKHIIFHNILFILIIIRITASKTDSARRMRSASPSRHFSSMVEAPASRKLRVSQYKTMTSDINEFFLQNPVNKPATVTTTWPAWSEGKNKYLLRIRHRSSPLKLRILP